MIQISYKDNNYYGRIEVPTPDNHNNNLKLHVQLSIANKVIDKDIKKIQFLGSAEDVIQKLPLAFILEFPPWNNIPPQVTYISINNQSLCVGEPIKGVDSTSTVSLIFTLRLTTFGNSGNNKSTMKENVDYSHSYDPNRNTTNSNNNLRNKMETIQSTSPENSVQPVKTFDSCGRSMIPSNGAHPWIGALFLRETSSHPKFVCGASLITKIIALTAGHCVTKFSDSDLYLTFGRTDIKDWLDLNTQIVKVDKSEVHPDYKDETSDADIAIIRFTRKLIFTSTVQPVCLWRLDSSLEKIVNETGVVVGWGKNENYEDSQKLKELYLPVVSKEICLRASEEFTNITSNRTFCAGKHYNSGPCNGDSGSGFYLNINGRWTIRGIVSRSLLNYSGRCDISQYSVYLDVAKHMQWINNFL